MNCRTVTRKTREILGGRKKKLPRVSKNVFISWLKKCNFVMTALLKKDTQAQKEIFITISLSYT